MANIYLHVTNIKSGDSTPGVYFIQGDIHATRKINEKIVSIVEPYMGLNFRIAVCDLQTKRVRITNTRYKSVLSVEGAFAHYEE